MAHRCVQLDSNILQLNTRNVCVTKECFHRLIEAVAHGGFLIRSVALHGTNAVSCVFAGKKTGKNYKMFAAEISFASLIFMTIQWSISMYEMLVPSVQLGTIPIYTQPQWQS